MWRREKQPEPEVEAGAPEWMVTFSDCMTLLLTFFVLLLSFSSFDDKAFRKLSVIFSCAQPAVGQPLAKDKNAFSSTKQIQSMVELDKGSEKPTLEKGTKDNLKEETETSDFRNRKVFLISSDRIFWGKGATVSSRGRHTLGTMAAFLKEVPGRIVISETGPAEKEKSNKKFGLPRAWEVMKYLTTKQGLDKKRFSISAMSTMAQESFESGEPSRSEAEPERGLEIVLLERSIYN
jgi:chemotaxis protein MotB